MWLMLPSALKCVVWLVYMQHIHHSIDALGFSAIEIPVVAYYIYIYPLYKFHAHALITKFRNLSYHSVIQIYK